VSPKPTGVLTWDVTEIARVLKVEPKDVHEYFTDGRRVSFLLERRLAREVIKGTLAPSEGAGFDLIDPSGKKWEVRSVTRGGIYFCPSYMVGSGRVFDEPGFLRKAAGRIVDCQAQLQGATELPVRHSIEALAEQLLR